MAKFPRHEPTLCLTWPAGGTLALAAVILLSLVGLGELATRVALAMVPATRMMQELDVTLTVLRLTEERG
jgi:hypothetical protein